MTKMYKVDGQWRTYQDLHDSEGYTLEPSIPVSYISSDESTWGENSGNHGYYTGLADDNDEYDPTQGEYFETNNYGWYSLDNMSNDVLLMPSNADPTLYFTDGHTICKAAKITPPRNSPVYFLADENMRLCGWHTLEWFQSQGWDETQPVTGYKEYLVIDTTTGEVLYQVPINVTNIPVDVIIIQQPEILVINTNE